MTDQIRQHTDDDSGEQMRMDGGSESLVARALRLLGTARLDGETERDQHAWLLGQLCPDVRLDGKDDAYCRTRLQVAIEDAEASPAFARERMIRRQQNAWQGGRGGDSTGVRLDAADEPDPSAARAAMIEQGQAAWQENRGS